MKLRRGGRAASAAVESWIWGRMSRVAVGGKSWERKSDPARLGVLARSDPVQVRDEWRWRWIRAWPSNCHYHYHYTTGTATGTATATH